MSTKLDSLPFLSFELMVRSFPNVHLSKALSVSVRHNFLSFLATAQALNIDFLPITWQSAQQDIGEGGTSSIKQALANIQMSLAFKRLKDKEKPEKTEAEIFQLLSNEITVLAHPSIQEHPNIVKLQGICWDISLDGKVWPVLVFEKSHFDNLYSFTTRPVGKELGIHHRLKLCIDIGEVIIEMHSNSKLSCLSNICSNQSDMSIDIIHGDIKPENVLIFKDSDGTYTARVTDFGYSTRYAGDTDLITIPISSPWNAPEHTRLQKMWTPSEAKKLETFSFGMLCLWTLFEKELHGLMTKTWSHEGSRRSCFLPKQSATILGNSKVEQKLSLLAQRLLETEETLSDNKRGALKAFFTSVLHEDSDRRSMSAGNLFRRYVLILEHNPRGRLLRSETIDQGFPLHLIDTRE